MGLAESSVEKTLKVLAIDTAEWCTSVALWEDGRMLASQDKSQESGPQASLLPSLVGEFLRGHSVDCFLVNVGPGSFTGIRIGVAFAKGLSLGLGIPLKGINSFMVTYLNLEAPLEKVLVLLDAHRQDVFGQLFHNHVPGRPQSFTKEDIAIHLAASPAPILAGSGVSLFLEGLIFTEALPRFRGANALAHSFFKTPTLFGEALPFYVRDADVNLRPSY